MTPQDIEMLTSSFADPDGVEDVQLTPQQLNTLTPPEQKQLLAEKRAITRSNRQERRRAFERQAVHEQFGLVEPLDAPQPVGDLGPIGPRELEMELLEEESNTRIEQLLESVGPGIIQERRPGETSMEWFNRKQRGDE